MTTKHFQPPRFGVDVTYKAWKNKLMMWASVTDLPVKKQGAVVLLYSLEGNVKAEKAVSELTVEQLSVDDGLKALVEKLDAAFKSEGVDEAYAAYSSFTSLKKAPDQTMLDYILEFEHKYAQISLHDMKLPDTIQAFSLLDGAGLAEEQRQLVLTIGRDLKYDSVKSALKRIFCQQTTNNDAVIKQEDACIARTKAFRSNFQGRSGGNRSTTSSAIKSSKLNPTDRSGNVSRCAICDSKMHWARACPHRQNSVLCGDDEPEEYEEVEMVLVMHNMTSGNAPLAEDAKFGVVDTACSKTVAGNDWFTRYMSLLSYSLKKRVKIFPSTRCFKFGDGREVKSDKKVLLPIQIGKKSLFIEAEIINEKIPLLMSKASLKKASTVLDMQHDKAIMLNQEIPLYLASAGHYAVRILPVCKITDKKLDDILTSDAQRDSYTRSEIMKIHTQFGHASKENLTKLLANSGEINQAVRALIKQVVDGCETCRKFKRPPPRPVVSLPWGKNFNDTVAIDLHQLEQNVWYMHMIDLFSRYSRAVIIRSKQTSLIVQKLLQEWISIFGTPHRILTDNGGEFDSEEFRDMCENFGIKVTTTAAYSPWSNGICERHNLTLTEIFLKVKESSKCDMQTALAWAISAKNGLISHSGFSPNQLVFGSNIPLPSVIHDELPALEGSTTSATVAKNLIAMHIARKACIENETSEKIRLALRKQTRQTVDHYGMGDEVFYKRNDDQKWKGPGKVIGQDGAVVFIRHGGQHIKAHTCRVQHAHAAGGNLGNTGMQKFCEKIEPHTKHADMAVEEECDEERDSDLPVVETNAPSTSKTEENESAGKAVVLQQGQMISYTLNGQRYTAKVMHQSGKRTGRYQNRFNIKYCSPEDCEGKVGSVDVTKIKDLQVRHDIENIEDIYITDSPDFHEAKEAELESWIENNVYTEVKDCGQKTISVRWVCTSKNNGEKTIKKTRLVARGFEEDTSNISKESPTCSKDFLRVLFSVVSQKKWKLGTIDIKTAFLQGENVDRDIYLKPPKEACTSKIWKLNKCVYGLSDASLKWYQRLKGFLLKEGAKMTTSDSAVFYWYADDELQGVVGIHVDDILWAGTTTFEATVIATLRSTFRIGCEKDQSFVYLGLGLSQASGSIEVDQKSYIESMKLTGIQPNSVDEEPTRQDKLKSTVGQLLWASTQTRPDISYDVCQLATTQTDCNTKNLILANKTIRKLQSQLVTLKYGSLGKDCDLKIVIYADAAHGNLKDGGSQGGHFVFLVGEGGRCSLLSWQSKRLRRVAKSTLAAETLSMSDAVDNAVFINALFCEIYFGDRHRLPMTLVTDNKSLFDALHSDKNVSNKRLRIEIGMLKEMMKNLEITHVKWVESKDQLADVLTKRGVSSAKLLEVLATNRLDI